MHAYVCWRGKEFHFEKDDLKIIDIQPRELELGREKQRKKEKSKHDLGEHKRAARKIISQDLYLGTVYCQKSELLFSELETPLILEGGKPWIFFHAFSYLNKKRDEVIRTATGQRSQILIRKKSKEE